MTMQDELRALKNELNGIDGAAGEHAQGWKDCAHHVSSRIDAILAEYADWVTVPKEPTEAMCRCADSNWSGFCADGMDAPRAAARRLYRDMIRAAAKAEEE